MADVAVFVARDGTELRGEVAGSGPTMILLVHDVGGDIDMWRSVRAELLEGGFRVVEFDLRGHGCSDGVADEALLVSDVEDVLAQVQSPDRTRIGVCAAGRSCAALWICAARSRLLGVAAIGAVSAPGHATPQCPAIAIYARQDSVQAEVAYAVRALPAGMIAGVPGGPGAAEMLRTSSAGLDGYVRMFFAAVTGLGPPEGTAEPALGNPRSLGA